MDGLRPWPGPKLHQGEHHGTAQTRFRTEPGAAGKYGITILGREVRTIDQAVTAAGAIGYPVVLKAVDERIIHKTDVGCVFLGIENEAELRAAHARLLDNVRAAGFDTPAGLLV